MKRKKTLQIVIIIITGLIDFHHNKLDHLFISQSNDNKGEEKLSLFVKKEQYPNRF